MVNEMVAGHSSRGEEGRGLRHRPERSEQCLNYSKLYQGQPTSSNDSGVPKA
ncbi:hypothetical protein RSSM_04453 [Rhodopirellula sallentina SM41]|uniref:Uncharacterized protein n=1 Tax=Rhodopirellula sallentina SM41 TaxID=1263870 RepID=M5TY50_9BACT|nr:hypothetical protein RSSM_04453 [Rhodopirellula sallentina SM41]